MDKNKVAYKNGLSPKKFPFKTGAHYNRLVRENVGALLEVLLEPRLVQEYRDSTLYTRGWSKPE